MKPGQWSFELRPEASWAVRNTPQMFGTVVITAVRPTDRGISRANLLAQSIYSGIITRRSNDLHTFGGMNLSWWWGPDQICGPFFALGGGLPPAGVTWTQLMNNYCAGTNGITIGTLTSIPGTVITTSPQSSSVGQDATRFIVDAWAAACGVEYRFNPQGKIDSAAIGASGLFRQTPTSIILFAAGGRDVNITGITARQLDVTEDFDSYASVTFVTGAGGANAQYPAVPWASAVASNFAGGAIGVGSYASFGRDITSNATTNADCLAVATGNYNSTASIKRVINVTAREYAITRLLIPGDYVYVYNPDAGIVDTSNQIQYRGALRYPMKVRVTEIDWPIEQGMGVHVISSDGNNTVTDITDWILWETNQPAQLRVGTMPRALAPVLARNAAGVNVF